MPITLRVADVLPGVSEVVCPPWYMHRRPAGFNVNDERALRLGVILVL